MIVDVHAHYHPSAYRDALARFPTFRQAGGFAGGRLPDTDLAEHVQARLDMMDAAGATLQVLSPAAGWAPYCADEALATDAARIINDGNAELIGRYQNRFKGLISLPLPHVDASLREVRRGYDELGMLGVNIHCSILDQPVVQPELEPVWEELNRRSSIVFFHPTGNGALSPLITEFGLGAALGTSIEDTLVGLHLVARKIPSRYPNITFIIPHLGGPMAMLLQRLDNQFSMQQHEFPEPPSVTARRFYYDTVGHGSHAALHCACTAYGADHVLVGTDFPVLQAYESYTTTVNWVREAGLSDADVAQIMERTAPTALKLEVAV
jgi:6-methylsalicylate decarboxylase